MPNVAWSIYVQSADLTCVHQDLGSRYATYSHDLCNQFQKTNLYPALNFPNTAPFYSLSPHGTLTLLLVQLFSVQ